MQGIEIKIQAGRVVLSGNLGLVEDSNGIVVFVHGSGSSRHSSRNVYVAEKLQARGLSTLLFDLLTDDEETIDLRTRHLRFDINLLTARLEEVTEWLINYPPTSFKHIGYFGASTGAAASLRAAAAMADKIRAVVSRGGRPDLAAEALPKVISPTLLIVGGADEPVIDLNIQAQENMRPGVAKMEIIPGATHLFEESGALDKVSSLAGQWFWDHLELSHRAYPIGF